ncbi:9775_t:CDS:2, partial [Scutellospora calospora]
PTGAGCAEIKKNISLNNNFREAKPLITRAIAIVSRKRKMSQAVEKNYGEKRTKIHDTRYKNKNKETEESQMNNNTNKESNTNLTNWHEDLEQEYIVKGTTSSVTNGVDTPLDINKRTENSTEVEIDDQRDLLGEKSDDKLDDTPIAAKRIDNPEPELEATSSNVNEKYMQDEDTNETETIITTDDEIMITDTESQEYIENTTEVQSNDGFSIPDDWKAYVTVWKHLKGQIEDTSDIWPWLPDKIKVANLYANAYTVKMAVKFLREKSIKLTFTQQETSKKSQNIKWNWMCIQDKIDKNNRGNMVECC